MKMDLILRLPGRSGRMTSLTIIEREGNSSVASAAESAFEVEEHRVVNGAFLCGGKDVGVTKLAAVPG